MLGRRELSEAQIRQRLASHGHGADTIDAAVSQLLDERAIDDARVAEAIARRQLSLRRGRLRVVRQIESTGIASATARRVVDDVFGTLDGDRLLEASLAKRLRGRAQIVDDAEFQRLYRYLIGQGFESDHVMRALTERCSRMKR